MAICWRADPRGDSVLPRDPSTHGADGDRRTGGEMNTVNHRQGNAVNHLRADCSGDTLTFYVNGEKLLEKTDAAFKTGGVGFAVTTQPKSETLDVRFDNFVVRSITP